MEQLLFNFLDKYIKLSQDEKEALTALDLFKSYKKGSLLLREGQRSNLGYFVLQGCLRSYEIVSGVEKTTAFYTELDSVEPLSKVNKTPSNIYLKCEEDSLLVVSSSKNEEEILKSFPKFEKLCRKLAENELAVTKACFENFRTASPEQRYLHLLQTKPNLVQRVPQYQIANYLGMTPQSLSRIRNRLRHKKT